MKHISAIHQLTPFKPVALKLFRLPLQKAHLMCGRNASGTIQKLKYCY